MLSWQYSIRYVFSHWDAVRSANKVRLQRSAVHNLIITCKTKHTCTNSQLSYAMGGRATDC